MKSRHSEQVMRAWGPTAAAAVVACLPPAAMVTGLGCAGFGLALDSPALAASGAVAATVGIVAQRSAGRRLRRRLRQERARNRLELHDLHLRLEQATRHLAEAVALAEAATRAMSGRPLVAVPAPVAPVAPAAPVVDLAPVPAAVASPEPTADTSVDLTADVEVTAGLAEPTELPVLSRRAAAARLAGPGSMFGTPVVPATPAELFTPAGGLRLAVGADGVASRAGDPDGWFAPVRPGGLPPAPTSPAVGIALVSAGVRPAQLARMTHTAIAGGPARRPAGSGRPPGPREPASGAIAVLAEASVGTRRLPARLAEAKVVDLSRLAHPAEPALIVVRRGKHVA